MMRTLLKLFQNTNISAMRWTSRLTSSSVPLIDTCQRRISPWPKIHRCQFCGNTETAKHGRPLSESLRVVQLKERAVLRVSGSDARSLLQGLITNDVEILEDGGQMRVMYSMFLNTQVQYACLIYVSNLESMFMLNHS